MVFGNPTGGGDVGETGESPEVHNAVSPSMATGDWGESIPTSATRCVYSRWRDIGKRCLGST